MKPYCQDELVTLILRQAAALMRERAEAATPGPWVQGKEGDPYVGPFDVVDGGKVGERYVICEHAGPDAPHIASWHPAVALAVADWLDGVALFIEAKNDEEYFDLDGDPIAPEDTHAIGSALAVARAYLGATQ